MNQLEMRTNGKTDFKNGDPSFERLVGFFEKVEAN